MFLTTMSLLLIYHLGIRSDTAYLKPNKIPELGALSRDGQNCCCNETETSCHHQMVSAESCVSSQTSTTHQLYIYIYVFKNLAKVALGNEQFLLHLTGKHTGFSKMSHSMLPAGQPRDLWSILHGKEDQTMDCTHRCSECTHLR